MDFRMRSIAENPDKSGSTSLPKRLSNSPISASYRPPIPKSMLSSRAGVPSTGTACPRGLIWVQNGLNINWSVFYLGNVGCILLATLYVVSGYMVLDLIQHVSIRS